MKYLKVSHFIFLSVIFIAVLLNFCIYNNTLATATPSVTVSLDPSTPNPSLGNWVAIDWQASNINLGVPCVASASPASSLNSSGFAISSGTASGSVRSGTGTAYIASPGTIVFTVTCKNLSGQPVVGNLTLNTVMPQISLRLTSNISTPNSYPSGSVYNSDPYSQPFQIYYNTPKYFTSCTTSMNPANAFVGWVTPQPAYNDQSFWSITLKNVGISTLVLTCNNGSNTSVASLTVNAVQQPSKVCNCSTTACDKSGHQTKTCTGNYDCNQVSIYTCNYVSPYTGTWKTGPCQANGTRTITCSTGKDSDCDPAYEPAFGCTPSNTPTPTPTPAPITTPVNISGLSAVNNNVWTNINTAKTLTWDPSSFPGLSTVRIGLCSTSDNCQARYPMADANNTGSTQINISHNENNVDLVANGFLNSNNTYKLFVRKLDTDQTHAPGYYPGDGFSSTFKISTSVPKPTPTPTNAPRINDVYLGSNPNLNITKWTEGNSQTVSWDYSYFGLAKTYIINESVVAQTPINVYVNSVSISLCNPDDHSTCVLFGSKAIGFDGEVMVPITPDGKSSKSETLGAQVLKNSAMALYFNKLNQTVVQVCPVITTVPCPTNSAPGTCQPGVNPLIGTMPSGATCGYSSAFTVVVPYTSNSTYNLPSGQGCVKGDCVCMNGKAVICGGGDATHCPAIDSWCAAGSSTSQKK